MILSTQSELQPDFTVSFYLFIYFDLLLLFYEKNLFFQVQKSFS